MPSLRGFRVAYPVFKNMTLVYGYLNQHRPLLESFNIRTPDLRLQQILQLKGLRRLSLAGSVSYTITDENIAVLPRSMNHLEMLNLWVQGEWHTEPSLMTVKVLITLAEHALCLVDLSLPLDVCHFEVEDSNLHPPSLPRLKTIRVILYLDSNTTQSCAGSLAPLSLKHLHFKPRPELLIPGERKQWEEGFRCE
ncbi:hypothetical protein FRB99_008997 [Tulasnella sp. 403]|nr:hypothetical protein FRB99_008997 [Tulasnella sp. 403]